MAETLTATVCESNCQRSVKRLYALAGLPPPIIITRRNPRETIAAMVKRAVQIDDAIFEALTK